MDKVTQQNAANAEESASASKEMSGEAEHMMRAIEELSDLVGGSRKETAGRQQILDGEHKIKAKETSDL
jgi:methyl-accepting chemotaxis protein